MLNEKEIERMIKVKELVLDVDSKLEVDSRDWEVEIFDRESVEELVGDLVEELDVEVEVVDEDEIVIRNSEYEYKFLRM